MGNISDRARAAMTGLLFSGDEAGPVEQQHDVFAESLGIYKERSEVRGELWAQFDEHDAFHHMRSKVARIGVMLQDGRYRNPGDDDVPFNQENLRKVILDETYDLINYAAFLARHITGAKPAVKKTDENSPTDGTATAQSEGV